MDGRSGEFERLQRHGSQAHELLDAMARIALAEASRLSLEQKNALGRQLGVIASDLAAVREAAGLSPDENSLDGGAALKASVATSRAARNVVAEAEPVSSLDAALAVLRSGRLWNTDGEPIDLIDSRRRLLMFLTTKIGQELSVKDFPLTSDDPGRPLSPNSVRRFLSMLETSELGEYLRISGPNNGRTFTFGQPREAPSKVVLGEAPSVSAGANVQEVETGSEPDGQVEEPPAARPAPKAPALIAGSANVAEPASLAPVQWRRSSRDGSLLLAANGARVLLTSTETSILTIGAEAGAEGMTFPDLRSRLGGKLMPSSVIMALDSLARKLTQAGLAGALQNEFRGEGDDATRHIIVTADIPPAADSST